MKVRIKDVQSIKDIEFEIKGFTCIVGKSNIGKSAILRSIRNLFKNKGGLTRIGAEFSEVEIKDSDYHIIWKKGKKHNYYKINNIEFDKLNKDIPEDLYKMGIYEVPIGKNKIDVQTNNQFFPLFLIDRNGREAAEVISKVSRLDIISSASKDCSRDLKSDKSKLKFINEEADNVEKSLKTFDNFDESLSKLSILKNQYNKLYESNNLIEEIKLKSLKLNSYKKIIIKLNDIKNISIPDKDLLEDIQNLKQLKNYNNRFHTLQKEVIILSRIEGNEIPEINQNNIDELIDLKRIKNSYQKIKKFIPKLKKISEYKIPEVNKIEKLRKIILILKTYYQKYQKLKKEIELFNQINIKTISPLKELEDKISNLSSLRNDFQKYKKEINAIKEYEDHLNDINLKLQKIELNLQKIETKLGKCPICERNF